MKIIGLAVALLIAFTTTTNAQMMETEDSFAMICKPQKPVLNIIMGQYGEKPVSFAYAANGELSIMYVNEDTGTWSFSIVRGSELCLMASGDNYLKLDNVE